MDHWLRGLGLLGLASIFLSHPAPADARPATIVVDDGSGAVLQATDADRLWYPASLTKMMTVYLAFEAIQSGRLALDEKLTVSDTAAAQPATGIGLRSGARINVETTIHAVLLQSANDAAVVLAERLGGSETEFASLMNAKAKALGMSRTVFRNASGLPDPDQVTTARDMAILGRALLHDYPQFYHFFSDRSFVYRGRHYGNINGILSRYPGADGIKTGFTCGSGYNLVASVKHDDQRLIGVVLGGRSRADRVDEMVRLLDAGFAGKAGADGMPMAPATLDAMVPAAGPDLPPEAQLSARTCTVDARAGKSVASVGDRADPPKLPGWGIVFGAYYSRLEATAAIRQSANGLGAIGAAAQAAVVPRSSRGLQVFAALLVGLSQEDATAACQRLASKGRYCYALNPGVLNNPRAAWR